MNITRDNFKYIHELLTFYEQLAFFLIKNQKSLSNERKKDIHDQMDNIKADIINQLT